MAVYQRTYQRYLGPTTEQWSRFLVIPRYAAKDVFKSRLLVMFFALCFAWPLFSGVTIYLHHNAKALDALGLPVSDLIPIDARFFDYFMTIQGWLAFFLILFVGPGQVSRDLVNNGLPLYLSRPFSRFEYVLGKITMMLLLAAAVTIIPGMILWGIQAQLAGWEWAREHLQVPLALIVGHGSWIVVQSLLALAFSAWVRWRGLAGFLHFALLMGGGFAALLTNVFFNTAWGRMFDIWESAKATWDGLLGVPTASTPPPAAGWLTMAALFAVAVLLLYRRIRAYEVVS